MSFIRNSAAEVNKAYAIKLNELFYTNRETQTLSQKIEGTSLFVDLRNIVKVNVYNEDGLNYRIWEITYKDGSHLLFYPILSPDGPSFNDNNFECFTDDIAQHYKAFRYLFGRLSKEEQNFLLEQYPIRSAMASPSFFESEF